MPSTTRQQLHLYSERERGCELKRLNQATPAKRPRQERRVFSRGAVQQELQPLPNYRGRGKGFQRTHPYGLASLSFSGLVFWHPRHSAAVPTVVGSDLHSGHKASHSHFNFRVFTQPYEMPKHTESDSDGRQECGSKSCNHLFPDCRELYLFTSNWKVISKDPFRASGAASSGVGSLRASLSPRRSKHPHTGGTGDAVISPVPGNRQPKA